MNESVLEFQFSQLGKKTILFKTVSLTWINVLSTFGGLVYLFYHILKIIVKPVIKFLCLITILEDLVEFKIIPLNYNEFNFDKNSHPIDQISFSNKDKKLIKTSLENKKHINQNEGNKNKDLKKTNIKDNVIDPFFQIEIKQNYEKSFFDRKFSEVKFVKSHILNSEDAKVLKEPPPMSTYIRTVKANCNLSTIIKYFISRMTRKQKSAEELKILKSGFDKIYDILNCKTMLKQLNELETVKNLIMDKNQIRLFNAFDSISIKIIERAIKIVDGQVFSFKNLDWRNVNVPLIEAYKNISERAPQSSIDSQILDLMDFQARKLLNKLILD